jgi:hypothetical protein
MFLYFSGEESSFEFGSRTDNTHATTDRPAKDSKDITVEGHLERSLAMRHRFTSFSSSLLNSFGIDFQIWDLHSKLKIQCQTDCVCGYNYLLTFLSSDFEYSISGNVDESFARSFPLPERLKNQKLWKYQIVLYK